MSEGGVFWHQGLYLQPQHFQYTDQRSEELLGQLAASVRPWFWGLRGVQADSGALATGTLALAGFSGLLPGTGVWLDIPGNAVCAGRAIPEDIVPVGSPLTVYAALKRMLPDGANAAMAESPSELAALSTRYGVRTGQNLMPDQYENGPAARIRKLTYVLRLVFEPEKKQERDSLLMPVLRLIRGSENYSVDQDYAPPCLSLEHSPLLSGIFREVRDRAIGKTRQMDSYKSLVSRGNMGEMATLFMILRSLSRFAARLELFASTRHLSPWEGYVLLREMVAELSVFSREYNPLGEDTEGRPHIPPYDHNDAAPSYRALRDLLVRLIDGLSTGPKYMIRLEFAPPFWQAALSPHVLDNAKGRNEYWLVLQSPGTDLAALAKSQHALIKAAPLESMATLLAHAVPGIPFSVESEPPLGVGRQEGSAYLRLHHDSPLWQDLIKQGGICLDWREAPSDLEAHFVVLGD